MPKVAVIMGSDSDFDVVKKCLIAVSYTHLDVYKRQLNM